MARDMRADFDPYREQIGNCHCQPCRTTSYANRTRSQQVADAVALLELLRAGTHERVEWADYVAAAKAERAAEIAAACTGGATERRMVVMKRGYSTSRDSDFWPYGQAAPMQAKEFVVGLGIGVSIDAFAERERAYEARVVAAERERAAHVERLIEADGRNRCTYFRVSGRLCDGHTELVVSWPGKGAGAVPQPRQEASAVVAA